jgi:hypothetical protein
MMRDRGIDVLVNECLINPVLAMGSVFVAYVCSFLAYLYLEFTKPAYNETGSFTPVAMAFAFLLGLQMCNVFPVPIKSGVSTLFVAMTICIGGWYRCIRMFNRRFMLEDGTRRKVRNMHYI